MKKVISFFCVMAMVLSMAIPCAATTVEKNKTKDVLTVEEYREWLSIAPANAEDAYNRQETLAAFEALTSSEQEKFVSYMKDEELMSAVAAAFCGSSEKTAFANGDIMVKTNEEVLTAEARASYTAKASHSRIITFFDIEIVEVQNYVTYTHDGSNITGVVKGGMVTVKNYTPFLGISYSNESLYYTTSRAYHIADLTCSFLYENSGIAFGSAEYGVYGTPSGNVGYWVTEY